MRGHEISAEINIDIVLFQIFVEYYIKKMNPNAVNVRVRRCLFYFLIVVSRTPGDKYLR